ncbi:MAG: UDP-3-O-[3-hydroxymyristoyl] N-acetylglucosamine deacetylase [Planctomycetaceae bacterium]|nr:UDP-3-O-[3-hydroxymyristoyl] N-acetylglucosamine deacetylase [Planctomycetaceae bacterium]
MNERNQRTIRRPIQFSGVTIFTNHEIHVRLLPADENTGIRFQRRDLPYLKPIPARIENAVFRHRRTAIEAGGASVEMIEHVMAALAGLQIDNCLVQLDGPEMPGLDGSCLALVDGILAAGIVEQSTKAARLSIQQAVDVADDSASIQIEPPRDSDAKTTIGYSLDYGEESPIAAGSLEMEITPQTFADEIAAARTFVLESEVNAMRAHGYGKLLTSRDLLVFGPNGVIDNKLRWSDECIRHKILDCIGDLALIGCELHGKVTASQSGHALNRELVRAIQSSHSEASWVKAA